MYEKIKQWYKDGRWSLERVRVAVVKGVITQEQYQEIVNAVDRREYD